MHSTTCVRRPRPTARDQAIALVIVLGGGAAVVLGFIWLLGLLSPDLDPDRPGNYLEQNRAALEHVTRATQAQHSWIDAFPRPLSPVEVAAGCVLVVIGLWLVYRMFMRCAEDLDEIGHWNRLIARRHRRKAKG